MKTLETLQNLGFKKNEALVYTALLECGLTTVGPLTSATKLHRQLVYQALTTLVDKRLVSFVLKNNRKHFQAASPTALITHIDEQKKQARHVLPALLKLQADANNPIEIHTLYGEREFFDNLREVTDSARRSDRIMRIIGGAKDAAFYRTVGKRYDEYVTLLQKHAIKKYLIAPEHFSEEFKQKFAKEKGNTLKTLSIGLSSPTYTRITPEMVSIEIYSDAGEITIIQIKNASIAKGYLEHFELLWKQAT